MNIQSNMMLCTKNQDQNAQIMKSVIVFTSQAQVADEIFSQIITKFNTINMFFFVFKVMSYNREPPTVKSMGLSVYIQTRFVENNAFHGKLEISVLSAT